MEIVKTPFSGLVEIRARKFTDDRGWFREFFKVHSGSGITLPDFVQDNLSFSKKGVVRGLHFQMPPHGQAKLVSVISGKVLDVVVDVRPNSPTFGKVYTVVLSGEEQNALFIPEGFAHGFAALEDSYFFYKVSSLYQPKSEGGIRWNDVNLNIDWRVKNPIVSKKDQELPSLSELNGKFLISQHA